MTPFPRLYAILDAGLLAARGLDLDAVFDGWLGAGVRLIQLRAKDMAAGPMLEIADRLSRRARAAGATFIVNDRADIARLAEASGVHLGLTDLSPAAARTILGAGAWIGRSTHSLDEVRQALAEPIDYLAVGAVYPTAIKGAGHPVVGLDLVRGASALARGAALPVVAIGGITLERAPEVLAAGASAVAVLSELTHHDAEARARAFLDRVGV